MIPNEDGIVVSPTKPLVNRQKFWFKKGKNEFNPKNVSPGYLDIDGNFIYTNRYWYVTDYMKLEEGLNYSYQGITVQGTAPYSAFYDENLTFISSFKQAIGTNELIIPSNARFVRFSIYNGSVDNAINDMLTFQLEQGEATEYEAFVEPVIYVKNSQGEYEEFIKKEENEEIYSYNEVRIGTYHGKPLYRKVVNFGALPNTATKNVSHNIDNAKFTDYRAIARNADGITFKLGLPSSTGSKQIEMIVNNTLIVITTSSDRSEFTECEATLEYTKTTD